MARLSVFHDGFTRDTAVAVLGPGGADLVETLAEQSLLTVAEADGATRFRMLETVREFAADRLTASGLRDDAQQRQDAWAAAYVDRCGAGLFGPDEIAAVDDLAAEENNLADVLRRALRDGDRAMVARLLACLGGFWTISGNHPRIFTIADSAEALLVDWDPPEELLTTAQLVVVLAHRAPQLDAEPLDRGAARHARALGCPRPSVGPGGLRDVRRRGPRGRARRRARRRDGPPGRRSGHRARWACCGPAW